MRVLHVTNIVSHHQLPLARCIASRVGEENFRFVATDLPMADRIKMGWANNADEPWILRAGENSQHHAEYLQWWDQADVVLMGCRDVSLIARRVQQGKLTFYLSERWWKPRIGIARLLHPRFARMTFRFLQSARSSAFHYLPIGVYAAQDMRRIASFPGRMWQWAYFTETPSPVPPCRQRQGPMRILYAGRMLELKRIDTLIQGFATVCREGIDARLTLIGDGPHKAALEQLVDQLAMRERVVFSPSIPAGEVGLRMREADVYVLPSNGYEGWGAVVNEAMAEGCATIASEDTGAGKTLIRHGENGLLFHSGDSAELAEHLISLAQDESFRYRLASEGQRTIVEDWSPQVAAERFISLSEGLLSGKTPIVSRQGAVSPI